MAENIYVMAGARLGSRLQFRRFNNISNDLGQYRDESYAKITHRLVSLSRRKAHRTSRLCMTLGFEEEGPPGHIGTVGLPPVRILACQA